MQMLIERSDATGSVFSEKVDEVSEADFVRRVESELSSRDPGTLSLTFQATFTDKETKLAEALDEAIAIAQAPGGSLKEIETTLTAAKLLLAKR